VPLLVRQLIDALMNQIAIPKIAKKLYKHAQKSLNHATQLKKKINQTVLIPIPVLLDLLLGKTNAFQQKNCNLP